MGIHVHIRRRDQGSAAHMNLHPGPIAAESATQAIDGAPIEHLDVLIVGAGLSGIDAAYRLRERCPDHKCAILEARDAIGGTWDLFRYPGVRSDSDMATLGFPFRPWREDLSIAGGEAIRNYIADTAVRSGIDRAIRFGHRVVRADWSWEEARWTIEAEADGRTVRLTCGFLYMCSGYYDYAQGYTPDFPGRKAFEGRFVHPQFWPDDLDPAGQRIVVIGSGATAVTLVPALAAKGATVTMLQRSPTYVVARPARDPIARRLRGLVPAGVADALVRWKNVALAIFTYGLSRRRPERVKALITKAARHQLGEAFDVDRHFAPDYDPWDQRLCLVPDGDLFQVLREGRATIVTDRIETFTPTGLRLASGAELAADVIVSATGLVVKLFGGVALTVGGEPVDASERLVYKGMMLSDVPNMALAFGYTNASWTLKCDLTARYVCRLLKHMKRHATPVCMPHPKGNDLGHEPMLDFTSGYVERAAHILPGQGRKAPWRVHQNYILDFLALRTRSVNDGTMRFLKRGVR
jgi:cation diffusion facilitator CzcD-associated flavoprotein CzcO